MDQTRHLNNPELETSIDYSPTKVNGIGIFGVVVALLLSYSLKFFLDSFSVPSIIFFLSVAALFLTALFLKAVFVKQYDRIAFFLFLESIALLSFFIFESLSFIVSGVFLAYLFCLMACFMGARELKYALKVRIWRVARAVLPKGVTALSFFIALGYLSLTHTHTTLVSQDTFNWIVLPSNSLVHYFYPQISLTDTFSDVANKYVLSSLESNPAFVTLPSAEKITQTNVAVKNLKDLVKKDYLHGVSFADTDKLIDVLYKGFSAFLLKISGEQKTLMMFVFGAVLFLIIRSLGMIFYLAVSLMAVLVYEILIASGFGLVVLEATSKETIVAK